MKDILALLSVVFMFVLWPISVLLIFFIFSKIHRLADQIDDLHKKVSMLQRNVCLGIDIHDLPRELKDRVKSVASKRSHEDAVIVLEEVLGVETSIARQLLSKLLDEGGA
jgi:hypothetical protein